MAEWCLPEAHKCARVGPAGNGPVHLRSIPYTPFVCQWTPIQSLVSESRLERQLKEQPDPTTGVHADGGQRSRVIHAPKFGGILGDGGGKQESGKAG